MPIYVGQGANPKAIYKGGSSLGKVYVGMDLVWEKETVVLMPYGLLYNFFVAIDARGISPYGYHVPSNSEYSTLSTWLTNNGYGYEGSGNDIAKSMASINSWNISPSVGSPGWNPETNNSSGFSGLGGGQRNPDGSFSQKGTYGLWWSSTEVLSVNGWCKYLYSLSPYVYAFYYAKQYGYNIRCLRNDLIGFTPGETVIDYDGNVYHTVRIGDQVWLTENLKTTHYNNGDLIPEVTDNATWAALTTGALCAYNNDWGNV